MVESPQDWYKQANLKLYHTMLYKKMEHRSQYQPHHSKSKENKKKREKTWQFHQEKTCRIENYKSKQQRQLTKIIELDINESSQ